MTRDERTKLKELDKDILRLALVLQNYIIERAKLDKDGTARLVDTIADTLRQCAQGGKP